MYQKQIQGQSNPNYNPFTQEYFRQRSASKKPYSLPPSAKKDKQELIQITRYNSKPLSGRTYNDQSDRQSRNLNYVSDCQKTIDRVKGNLNHLKEQKLILKTIQDFHMQPLNNKQQQKDNKKSQAKNPMKILVNKYQNVILDGYQSLSEQMKSIFNKHHEINENSKKKISIRKRSQSQQLQKRLRLNQHNQFDSIIDQCYQLHKSVDYSKRQLQKYSKVKRKPKMSFQYQNQNLQFQNFVEDEKILQEIENIQYQKKW